MKKNNFDKVEFYTSLVTAVLVFILTYIQFNKGRDTWWIILLAGILMAANAYVKYKKLNKDKF
ncbi:hypothetical protein [uncultured Anaerococcus sp.]|uniref:hypothetical protein n=1 Tax=uncultured Anaerococcus sp. TaxID=293428 RepID=UPI0025F502C1|nr:hypothetical protein [uncultured Anaerococcus sp.]